MRGRKNRGDRTTRDGLVCWRLCDRGDHFRLGRANDPNRSASSIIAQ